MASDYYYLIAGLLDIALDDEGPLSSFSHFTDEITPLLDDEDARLLDFLRFGVDNKNLSSILDEWERPFEEGGTLSKDEIHEVLKHPESVPLYMQTIIEAWQRNRPLYPNATWEDQINSLFFDATQKLSNDFLKNWFTFDVNLKNVVTAIKCRDFDLPLERRLTDRIEDVNSQAIIGTNEVAEAILNNVSPDFGTTPVFPCTENILSLTDVGPEEFEKGIDKLKWDWLSEAVSFNYFDIAKLLAYCIKLSIANRWQNLRVDRGGARLNEILGNIEEACNFNYGPERGLLS